MFSTRFRRFTSWFIVAALIVPWMFVNGCGEETENTTDLTDQENRGNTTPIMGLQGDTYRNQEYLFKVGQLPVEGWTIQEVTNLASYDQQQAWKAAFDPGTKFNRTEDLLLMEPVSVEEFQPTLTGAMEQQIPLIFLQIEEQTATSDVSPQRHVDGILAQMEQVYDPASFEITDRGELLSKDRNAGYFVEITWLETGAISREAYFMRRDSQQFFYRFYFWTPSERYEEMLPIYQQVLEGLEFNIS